MEATNISIKQQNSVSINIETLQTIKQHLWLRVKGSWLRVAGAWSLPRIYRKILRMMYAAGKVTERHPVIADSILWLMCIGLVAEVIFFC